mmetsp:Transcript_71408/g.190359  ORF Transcript_71408/g.190359 Transcript_71408/m.190359 type:complete len:111 (-) Transcript_71408:165-497(-)
MARRFMNAPATNATTKGTSKRIRLVPSSQVSAAPGAATAPISGSSMSIPRRITHGARADSTVTINEAQVTPQAFGANVVLTVISGLCRCSRRCAQPRALLSQLCFFFACL